MKKLPPTCCSVSMLIIKSDQNGKEQKKKIEGRDRKQNHLRYDEQRYVYLFIYITCKENIKKTTL